ncbi:hypothetical protein AXK61_06510 [Tsukamurella pseudospumae]|uniref:Uncharacterized protein n=1 Tax=Tsukamurella pseudospumae TaxID=239498 RepID=A0A137YZ45_9ACTN|nr:hypothetical protein AXK61_06510 [Tsukamurella pseudospumae]
MVRLAATESFRCHVRECADGQAGARQTGFACSSRDAEIDEVDEVAIGDEDVRRLDVAVLETDRMRGVQSRRDLVDDRDGSVR